LRRRRHRALIRSAECRIVDANLVEEALGPVPGLEGLKDYRLAVATNRNFSSREFESLWKADDLTIAGLKYFSRGHVSRIPFYAAVDAIN
jgi:hypothetical protein